MKFWKRKEVLAWAFYDWANSSFAVTVMAGFFPLFFQKYWNAGVDPTLATARLGIANSASALVIAFLSPTLGAISDVHSSRKNLLLFFTVMGVIFTFALGLIGPGQWAVAAWVYAFALLGFNGMTVFYDALLPMVAREEESHSVSAFGFSLGYLGGGLLFAVNVLMYLKPSLFGLEDGVAAVKASFFVVALWWALFTLPLAFYVKEKKSDRRAGSSIGSEAIEGLKGAAQTLQSGLRERGVGLFLLAYWIYIDGVYTVMKMAVDFGIAIGLSSSALITALLLVQFIGFPSALVFGYLGNKWDPRKAVIFGLVLYSIAVLWGARMTTSAEFYGLAILIGLVQGGVQSLSRSILAQQVPAGREGEFFGLFNLIGRFAAILGPLLIGAAAHLTGNPRFGLLPIVALFVIGGVMLACVQPRVKVAG